MRSTAADIVELFEDLLDKKGIEIPCADEFEEEERHHDGNTAKLYGMEFWDLVDDVDKMLEELIDQVYDEACEKYLGMRRR